jgi:hypothetical protein
LQLDHYYSGKYLWEKMSRLFNRDNLDSKAERIICYLDAFRNEDNSMNWEGFTKEQIELGLPLLLIKGSAARFHDLDHVLHTFQKDIGGA